ncbi:acyl carrier protein [uncultured Corynebacterium sp.]|uniref:acyl carrier protein n=1 Tax=uncultured Corynebacterium sp. TaxID=159447 RepID=UPI00259A5379|nr:acyl carrier protein [uncultured Corynebacterium sp.]
MAENTAGISEQQKQKLAAALGGSAAGSDAGSGVGSTPNSSSTKTSSKGAGDGVSDDSMENRVMEIVEDATGVEREEITRKSSLDDDLGVDSLTLVDIAVRLEEEFDIQVEDEAINGIGNVGQLVKLVEKRVK